MSGNEAFELINETGWRRGLSNMLRSGLARWFKTKTWWIHCLIWGGMAAIIVTLGRKSPTIEELLMISFIFTGIFPAVGVVIIMQDTIVGEKREGTASWVLSKPLTRPAFVLSKVIANSTGVLVTMIIVPFCIAFTIISINQKSLLTPLGSLAAMGVIFISHYFFLSLTLMLGTLLTAGDRLSVFPWQYYSCSRISSDFYHPCVMCLPWNLVVPIGTTNPLVLSLTMGTPVQSDQLIMLLVVALEGIVFTLIGLWRFNREEF